MNRLRILWASHLFFLKYVRIVRKIGTLRLLNLVVFWVVIPLFLQFLQDLSEDYKIEWQIFYAFCCIFLSLIFYSMCIRWHRKKAGSHNPDKSKVQFLVSQFVHFLLDFFSVFHLWGFSYIGNFISPRNFICQWIALAKHSTQFQIT